MTESNDPDAKRLKLNESKPKRRLGSFWKSNQDIQALSNRLAVQSQEFSQRKDTEAVTEELHSSLRKDSDEIVVVHDSVTNACATLPHPRHICGRYPFDIEPHPLYCEKCYCYVCQIPASECKTWIHHCDATDSPLWQQARQQNKMTKQSDNDVIVLLEDSDEETGEPLRDMDVSRYPSGAHWKELAQALEEDPFQHHFDDEMKDDNDEDMVGQKPRKEARITEVLAHNLRVIDNEMNANISTLQRTKEFEIDKMSGDVPDLNLQSSFFVEGVKIGWPYPVIMPPQRQMAIHLTKAFKNSRHCVIESPTGTGKSAAILCSALAWQRYHAKTSPSNEVVKIIYCSRTHSQVGQMVASLRKTPYRPRMAILGSRDRLCIHKKLRPRSKVIGEESVQKTFDNINVGCQIRTQNVDSYRRSRLKRLPMEYNDDSPPTHHPGDDGERQNALDENENEDEETGEWMESEKFQTCPHYRQLTNKNVTRKIHSMFVPDKQRVNCCSRGGEKSKFGTHDIEDLVRTGMNPNIRSGVALYRGSSNDAFGITMNQSKSRDEPISIKDIRRGSVAYEEGSLSVGDVLVSVNGIDVSRGHTILSVSERIRESKNPLVLDVYSRESGTTDLDVDEYSEESACPYYLSKILSKSADLVFCPYNYILDPDIRSAMELDIQNTIVILDEAHNVEDTLRSLGSDKFGEIELLKMLDLLNFYAAKWESRNQRLDWGRRNGLDEEETLQDRIPDICHSLLLFLEPILMTMRDHKEKFESDQIQFGVTKAIDEYERFKSPDDKEFEVRYFGPTGSGDGKKPIGCQRFFESINISKDMIDLTVQNISDFMQFMNTKRGNPRADERRKLADRVCKLITMLCNSFNSPEHYYISTAISANGNLDFASGKGDGASNNRFRRYPKQIPMVPKVDEMHRPRMCRHPRCNQNERGTTSHERVFDGSTPRWEIKLIMNVLTPAILMAPILRDTRSVVLASGTLAPLDSLCAELNLLPPGQDSSGTPTQTTISSMSGPQTITGAPDTNPLNATTGRLQVQPRPLEANHVVNLTKQLLAVSVGHFVDGSQLSVKMSNYSRPGFHDKLGNAIATIVEGIPTGGVLIFVPSFSFLRKCVSNWELNGTWDRLIASKGDIVVEPNGQAAFEKARDSYNTTIERKRQCILLAVFRGKMSEGVSFNDHYARGVICVGVPLPNTYDRSISAKMAYNNEQRRFHNKQVLGGNEWYTQQAYRALAQAIGRCIRHSADYGTIILLDSRHCDDGHVYYESGTSDAHKNLPKWMRHAVKTLRPDHQMLGRNDLLGGWKGLQSTMKDFFEEARRYSLEVSEKQKKDFELSQERQSQSKTLEFDQETGQWSSPDF